jgi:hypothetical protein
LSKLPILSGLYELDPAPRRFLLFIVFNVISWQCIIGPTIVLFARRIDMPPSWVGFLISFTPISMVLVVATGLLVMHWGSKRVMFVGWLLRNLIACTVFTMPWAMRHGGPHSAWYVLMGSTLGFCLMRAVGGGGWFPWLHEVVPENQRGAYFSAEAGVTQLLNVGVALSQAVILRGDPGVNRFLLVYGIGIASGFTSLAWMRRIPGGAPSATPASLKADVASYRTAIGDRAFLVFACTAALCFSSTAWFGAASVLYMRDALGMKSWVIMVITAAASIAIMATVRHWARFAERNGSGLAIALALIGHATAALSCILLIPGASWTPYAMGPIVILASMFGSAFWMTVHRAMLGYVTVADRVGYTNVWQVCTSVALGVTPILVGQAISHGALWGFRVCFAIAGVGGICCALAVRAFAQDRAAAHSPRHALALRSPLRAYSQIARITLGIDETID